MRLVDLANAWRAGAPLVASSAVIAGGTLLFVSLNSFPKRLRCVDSTPDDVRGRPTGYAVCQNGALHRPEEKTCPSFLPRPEEIMSSYERRLPEEMRNVLREAQPIDPSRGDCRFDRDCTRAPHGHCRVPLPDGRPRCDYGCVRDSDCSSGICLCGDPVGRCVRALCTSDRGCPPLSVCTFYHPAPGCFYDSGFACQKPMDECTVDADCDAGTCGWRASDRVRVCTNIVCNY
jgi:hypothetical protein